MKLVVAFQVGGILEALQFMEYVWEVETGYVVNSDVFWNLDSQASLRLMLLRYFKNCAGLAAV